MTFPTDFLRPLGSIGAVSSIGLGTYLGDANDADDERYREALSSVLDRGITLVDTAINYRCQRSERLIGDTLRAQRAAGRASPIVCTKGGYVPLDNLPPSCKTEYRAYVKREYFDSGVVAPADMVSGGHCISPSFLRDQVARSRRNMGVDAIDLYYLHNPEQQLVSVERTVFERRLADAFAALESCVADGQIRAYGCSTWHGFRSPAGDGSGLNLETIVKIARDVGGDNHHFAAIQLPVSLAMPEAVRVANQTVNGMPCSLLQAAEELGIAVIVSAPLMHGQLTRDLPTELWDIFPDAQTDAQRAIAFARTLPGVTSVVVGMRSPSHIDENLRLVV